MRNKLITVVTLMVLQMGSAQAVEIGICVNMKQESNEIKHLLQKQALYDDKALGRSSDVIEYLDPEATGPDLSDRQIQVLESRLVVLSEELSDCGGGGGGGGGTGGNSGSGSTSVVTVTCESWDHHPEACQMPRNIFDVVKIQQLSSATCGGGRYYHNGDTLYVLDGCRAVFNVHLTSAVQVQNLTCESWNYAYATCNLPTAGTQTVWLRQRYSDSRCEEGNTWGLIESSPSYIWVDHGCQGMFSSAQ